MVIYIYIILKLSSTVFTHANKLGHQVSTFISPGNAVLGPLDEKAATLGEATMSPTTVTVRDIFTTGLLAKPYRGNHLRSNYSSHPKKSNYML